MNILEPALSWVAGLGFGSSAHLLMGAAAWWSNTCEVREHKHHNSNLLMEISFCSYIIKRFLFLTEKWLWQVSLAVYTECLLETLASTYGPGPVAPGPYDPWPLIIWKNILSQICSRIIYEMHTAPGACSKYVPGAVYIQIMLLEHILLRIFFQIINGPEPYGPEAADPGP